MQARAIVASGEASNDAVITGLSMVMSMSAAQNLATMPGQAGAELPIQAIDHARHSLSLSWHSQGFK